jgi:hypothetical protein
MRSFLIVSSRDYACERPGAGTVSRDDALVRYCVDGHFGSDGRDLGNSRRHSFRGLEGYRESTEIRLGPASSCRPGNDRQGIGGSA